MRGTDLERLAAGLLMVGFPSTSVPAETRELIDLGVRSFVLFARNLETPDQIRQLAAEIRHLAGDDALIAIDHEGGRVNRLRHVATPWPAAMAWCATGNLALAQEASRVAAQELSSLGINLNFAPVADILGHYRNPVLGNRCFSDDPGVVRDYVAAFVAGHQAAGVGSTAKHAPGHGGTRVDSHVDLPEIGYDPDYLRANDLIPFAGAVEAGVDCLMISHVWYSSLDPAPTPATVSPAVLRFVRQTLGFDGVIVTDAMEMSAVQTRLSTREAIPAAILAGCDLATIAGRLDEQRGAVEALRAAARDGLLPPGRIREAAGRLETLRARLARPAVAWPRDGERLARAIAGEAVTLVRDVGGFLPLASASPTTLGIVTFPGSAGSGAEEGGVDPRLETGTPALVRAARRRHPRLVSVQARPDAGIDAVLGALGDAQTVIAGTSCAIGQPFQAAVVNALLGAGKRVVVVALRDPFDLLAMPAAPCYLATYDDTAFSIEAAVSVLFGEREPRGRLPVGLPGLYPRGHGLTLAP